MRKSNANSSLIYLIILRFLLVFKEIDGKVIQPFKEDIKENAGAGNPLSERKAAGGGRKKKKIIFFYK